MLLGKILLAPYKVIILIKAKIKIGINMDLSILYFEMFFISITNKYNTLKCLKIQLFLKQNFILKKHKKYSIIIIGDEK